MKDLQDQLLYQEKEIPQIHSCKILKEERERIWKRFQVALGIKSQARPQEHADHLRCRGLSDTPGWEACLKEEYLNLHSEHPPCAPVNRNRLCSSLPFRSVITDLIHYSDIVCSTGLTKHYIL